MDATPNIDARSIIARWPSKKVLAADAGRSPITIHSWSQRNSIPADADVTLVAAAKRRGIRLSFEELAHSRSRVLEPGE